MHLDKFLVGAGIAATAFARGVPHHSHVARQNQYQQQTVIATTTVSKVSLHAILWGQRVPTKAF